MIFNERRDVMEKVVCESCGREIPEKAKICPYCHQKNVARTGGAKSVLKKIWDAVVMLVGLAVIICGVSQYLKNNRANEGKGADDPAVIAKAYMIALDERNAGLVSNYLDDRVGNSNLIDELKQGIQEFEDKDVKPLNFSGMKYEVSEEYEKNGYTNVVVTVDFAETGLFGGNTIFGKSGYYTLIMHKAKTPDGYKWFLGGEKDE